MRNLLFVLFFITIGTAGTGVTGPKTDEKIAAIFANCADLFPDMRAVQSANSKLGMKDRRDRLNVQIQSGFNDNLVLFTILNGPRAGCRMSSDRLATNTAMAKAEILATRHSSTIPYPLPVEDQRGIKAAWYVTFANGPAIVSVHKNLYIPSFFNGAMIVVELAE